MRQHRSLLLVLVLGWAFHCGTPQPPPSPATASARDGLAITNRQIALVNPSEANLEGLTFRLRSADDPVLGTPAPPAALTALPGSVTERLLSRLSPLEEAPTESVKFPDRGRPAPTPNKTVDHRFPPARSGVPAPKLETTGPLTVARRAPEGSASFVPRVSVTFSEPVAAVFTTAPEKTSPVRLTPKVDGEWRWLSTDTIVFEPTRDRLPMATDYRVTTLAGWTSALGRTLDEPITWTFSTPAPTVSDWYPRGDRLEPDVVQAVTFDQPVDADEVRRFIEVTVDDRAMPVRAPTEAELSKVAAEAWWQQNFRAPRAVAFKTVEPLPVHATIKIALKPGWRGREGPRRVEKPTRHTFKTYPPFELQNAHCDWRRACPPLSPLSVTFTNPVDPASFDADRVSVEPEVEGREVVVEDRTITVKGLTQGRTTYRVTIPGGLTDVFGQTLGRDTRGEVEIGAAEPRLTAPGELLVVLDPDRSDFEVISTNYRRLQLKAWRTAPPDWPALLTSQTHSPTGNLRGRRNKALAKPTMTRTLKVDYRRDAVVRTPLGLAQLGEDWRHAFVEIRPFKKDLRGWHKQYPPVVRRWIQRTGLGLQVRVDNRRLWAWVTDLKTGRPVEGANVKMSLTDETATTDAGGLARLALSKGAIGTAMVTATVGDDTVFVPERLWDFGPSRWTARQDDERIRWFVFDDRRIYRPQETVHLKGWLRRSSSGPDGDLLPFGGELTEIRAVVRDAQGVELERLQTKINAWGGFDLEFDLPPDINLGQARVELKAGPASTPEPPRTSHAFKVQAFRRPEFEVALEATTAPTIVGQWATVTAAAKYFAGGPLPKAPIEWRVDAVEGQYRPPGHPTFSFGVFTPWWGAARVSSSRSSRQNRRLSTTTDSDGKDVLRIDLLAVDPPRPTVLTVEAAVSDLNRQTWSAETTLLVHPAELYVGVRTARGFGQAGTPMTVDVLAVDIDGAPSPNRTITATLAQVEWRKEGTGYGEVETNPVSCRIASDAQGGGKCELTPGTGGRYRLTAGIVDDRGRKNVTTRTVWVAGTDRSVDRNLSGDELRLVRDQKSYLPTETARVLVRAPFPDAEGLLTLEREGIIEARRFTVNGTSHTLEIPLAERYLPELHVCVELVGRAPRRFAKGEFRPAFAHGCDNLSIEDRARRLSVEAKPVDAVLEPGAKTAIKVRVTDADGRPANDVEVAVVVVDEAILALTDATTPDPLPAFYPPRDPGVRVARTRNRIVIADATTMSEAKVRGTGVMRRRKAFMGSGGARRMIALEETSIAGAADRSGDVGAPAIAVRQDFSALATFAPEARTGADGRATVAFTLPDSLTRYRVMAVVADKAQRFGFGEAALTARRTLMVRPSPPRFANYGDTFELPVVVQNLGETPIAVDVAVRASNVELTADRGFQVTVPPQDRREVRFGVRTQNAGQARFQVAAAAGPATDAAEFELPVFTPATTEAFATYGTTTEGAVAQPIRRPKAAIQDFGGLEVTTASTQLQALTDAFLYLQAYPFACSEQIASRVMSVVALKDVLAAFKADGLGRPEEILAAVDRDIARLVELQSYDGGWGFWSKRQSWPFVAVHVMHALVRAKDAGFAVPQAAMNRGHTYLQRIENRLPPNYPRQVRQAIEAYALYVRALMGDLDEDKARALIRRAGTMAKIPLEVVGWLYPVLADGKKTRGLMDQLHRRLNNDVTETAGEAHFVTRYGEGAHLVLHSDRRVDGLLLEGLLRDRRQDILIPKLVRGLLAHRTEGRWGSTQENAWVLLALNRYFRTYERVTPDFVARLWLGEQYVGEQAYKGRSTRQDRWFVPLKRLSDADALVLGKTGPGRLYYRLGLKYAPADLNLEALSRGFSVTRSYEAVDAPDDVRRDDAGVWRVRGGALVRVKLSMVAPGRRYHVALVDALPAGFEALNSALAVSPSSSRPARRKTLNVPWWWLRPWYEHQNLGDARVEAFSSALPAGVYSYEYVARATTLGQYVVPPAKAEQMYAPETFGRTPTDRVIVE